MVEANDDDVHSAELGCVISVGWDMRSSGRNWANNFPVNMSIVNPCQIAHTSSGARNRICGGRQNGRAKDKMSSGTTCPSLLLRIRRTDSWSMVKRSAS